MGRSVGHIVLLGAAGLLAFGCAKPLPPNAVPGGALPLGAGARYGELDCPRGDCVHWFRARVGEQGKLIIDVSDTTADASRPARFEVTLADRNANTLAADASLGRQQVQIIRGVDAASYLVAVSSARPGVRFNYSVRAEFRATPPPRPVHIEPKFDTLTSPVLEAEGYGRDTEAVLIEHGQRHGMRKGLRGRLIEDGVEIGKVVIDQVYADGSRAVVEGELSGPVTGATIVEIDVPIGELPALQLDAPGGAMEEPAR